jgi:hypothetical protein
MVLVLSRILQFEKITHNLYRWMSPTRFADVA